MFESITSAEYTSQMWKPRGQPSRFHTAIWLLNTVIWSIALFGKANAHPNATLIVASGLLICLEVPMICYIALSKGSKTKLNDRWLSRRSRPWMLVRLPNIAAAAILVCLLPALFGFGGRQWEMWSDIGLPFVFLLQLFGDSNSDRESPDKDDTADARRRWDSLYKLGRRAGAFFMSPMRRPI